MIDRILPRLLIGAVFLVNVQSAISLFFWPERYAPQFELAGDTGAAAVRGFGVLFLMWNVPYAVALWDPIRYRLALLIAIAMQVIGLVGESLIYFSLPETNDLARMTIARFTLFDALGLAALLVAAWLTRKS
jgi:hypothetical protein